MRPRTLDRYVAWKFLAIYAASLVSFSLVYVLVDSISQYGALADKAEGFGSFAVLWLRFYAAQLPLLFCRVLGPVTLAASAGFSVTLLERANELTPVMAAGVSLHRLLAPVLVLSAAISAGSAAVQELWVPAHGDEIREARALGRGQTTLRHAKHFDSQSRVLAVFSSYQPKVLQGEGLALMRTPEGYPGPDLLLEARTARWVSAPALGDGGEWVLEEAQVQEYDRTGALVPHPPLPDSPPGSPPRLLRRFPRVRLAEILKTTMIPQDLQTRESQEPYLWLSELWRQTQRSSDLARWRVRLYTRLVDPLHGLVLVILGVPVILSRGSRNIFLSAITLVVLSGLYFVAYTFLINLGNRGALAAGVAVGLAPLFFGALGVTWWYRGMRS